MGHGRALINIENSTDQLNIYKKIISKNLSVRNTESLVRNKKDGSDKKNTSKKKINFNSTLLNKQVSVIKKTNGSGSISIIFNSEKELNKIKKLLNE
jgi:ParB family chromosome partitioning protein